MDRTGNGAVELPGHLTCYGTDLARRHEGKYEPVRPHDALDFSWIRGAHHMCDSADTEVVPQPAIAVSSPELEPRSPLFDLLVHPRSRAVARQMIGALPERHAQRLKSRLVALLDRLHTGGGSRA